MSDLRAELTERIDIAAWDWLVPHVQRDALVVVDPRLDLVDVGMAIANDNVVAVQRWIGEALIYKPTKDELNDWERDRSQTFKALIVQPYVLMQSQAA